jgi:hypothetical protein
MLDSKAFELNANDLKAVGKNALLVGVAAVLTYVGQNLSNIDLGAGTALVVPVLTLIIDSLVKWVKDNVNKPAVVTPTPAPKVK